MTNKPVVSAITELLTHPQLEGNGAENLSDAVAWLLHHLLTERMGWASSSVEKASGLLAVADLSARLIDEFIKIEQGTVVEPSSMSAWSSTASDLLASQAQRRRALIQSGRQIVTTDFYSSLSKSGGANKLAESLKETCLRLIIENPASSPDSSQFQMATLALDKIAHAFSQRVPRLS